ncbi:MAG: reverse transcriptase/maturase family protein [bacterium]
MKRHHHLFEKICSFENLLLAAKKAQRGKRFKTSTSNFNFELESSLVTLQRKLQDQTYRMGEYKHFHIYDPKKRLISAAPYCDRVVQHALCNIIEPIFDRSLIFDSYACRKGKGSHKAVDCFTEFSRKNKYVLKCDVKAYFASIDHDILYQLILQKIKDSKTLWLIKLIIDSTPSPGIPIGNLTSQIFANLYLSGLDHYLKEAVGCWHYLRYMDDLIVFSNDKADLRKYKKIVQDQLESLKLKLHLNKCQIYLTKKGVSFLGYKVYPTHRLIIRRNIKRLRKRLRNYFALLQRKLITEQKIICSVQSWLGYAIHADSYNLRKQLLTELDFQAKGISL